MLLSIICQLFLGNLCNIDAIIRYGDSGLWRYFLSAGMEKGIKYNQDQSSIMPLFEHNFRHNIYAVVLRVTLKSI